MGKVIDGSFSRRAEAALRGGPQPPDNRGMEARVTKLEAIAEKTGERLTNIECDLAVLRTESTRYATKSDLHELEAKIHRAINDQTWKLITWTTGFGAALVAITFFIARNVR